MSQSTEAAERSAHVRRDQPQAAPGPSTIRFTRNARGSEVAQLEVAAQLHEAQAAMEAMFWHFATGWRAHMFHRPRQTFDFDAFAPEAREMMEPYERAAFDALARATKGRTP